MPACRKPIERQTSPAEPFWRTKTLDDMTEAEWESLCDGCGLCCLVKLEDDDTTEVFYTDVGCTLLDGTTCRCRSYETRKAIVPDCLKLTPETVRATRWLPRTCGYRLIAEGRDLYSWHPLRSGSASSVHRVGASVRGRVAGPEEAFGEEELMERIVEWPGELPEDRQALGFMAVGTEREP